jgi:hypothetical protein
MDFENDKGKIVKRKLHAVTGGAKKKSKAK